MPGSKNWNRKYSLAVSLAALLLLGQGCLRLAQNDGGIYRSITKGEIWEKKVQLLTVGGRIRNFADTDVLTLAIDPQDHRTLYAGTNGLGVLYSYDGAESWQQFPQLAGGVVRSLAIDAVNKCVLYAAITNRVFKSFDCGRSWQQAFVDTRGTATITFIAADPSASGLLFAGNRLGDILKTTDSGFSWTVVKRLGNPIVKILISPRDRHTVYAATEDLGLFKSSDMGLSWLELSEDLKQFSGALSINDLIFNDKSGDGLLLSSRYGLLRSFDGGSNWQPLILLTPPGAVTIRAVGVNQNNNKEIYYATDTTFYRTFDGGVKWSNKQLPSTREPAVLLVDQVNPNILYLGISQPKEKRQLEFIKYEPN